ncbi:MAG TPA: hypothetical protein ENH94_12185, partial [Phycisphaerales bacterium]|nr:hypothetical protein [Phycisphaerales bacterium]
MLSKNFGMICILCCCVTASVLVSPVYSGITDSQFGLFDGIAEPAPLSSGTLTMEKENWTPSAAGTWNVSSIWDETDAFHAQFDFDDDNPNGIDWRVKISKGGGLYSIDLPGLGEIMPPQHTFMSPWNDDTCLATLYSNNNSDPQMQGYGNGFVHQVGMYIKPWLDPLNNKPQFSPLLAEDFDAASGSYFVVNLGLCPSPSVNRADVLFYMKYRHLGSGVIEITFYFYNYGDFDHGYPAVPWTGVRESVYSTQIRGVAGGGFELFPYSADRRYNVRTSGGWIGHTADSSDNNSPAYSLVHGIDKHYGESGYEDKSGSITCFTLDATSGGRDFKVMATDIYSDIKCGEGLYFRTYMVMGTLDDVVATSEQLVDEVEYAWLEFNEMTSDFLPLYEITLDGQTTLSATKPDSNATPIAHSYANPVKNSVPLVLMRDVESGTYVLSTDPYAVCGKRAFENLYQPGHSKYATYQDRVIYQPYDGRTEWIGLLGFVIPESKSTDPQEYQYLWEVLGEDILFVPGEKFAADELLIWTGSPSNPGPNNPPAFANDKIVKTPTDNPADGYVVYSDTIFGSATDPDGDSLTYSKLIGPAWLNIATDGSIYGNPSIYNVGLNTWSVQVSDGNGRTDVATLNITVSTSYDDNNAIVQWGQRDGQGDIITAPMTGDASTFDNVYDPGVPASPSGPGYYPAPASDNRTPIFYAASQRNDWHIEIWQQVGGETSCDYIGAFSMVSPGTTFQGMVVWQSADFMPVDGPVAGFNAQLKNSKGGDRGDLYWLIEKGGSWYISEMVGEFNSHIFPSTISTANASVLTWYDFTPFGLDGNAAGVATIGSQAFITMYDITSVGYFYETENTSTSTTRSGSQLIYFSVTAYVDTGTHHWPFDTDASDMEGDFNGTFEGGAAITNVPGEYHFGTGAVTLDGIDDYVEITGYKGISGSNSRTCAAWIKTDQSDTSDIMTWGGLGSNGGSWMVQMEAGKLRISVWGSYKIGTTTINDGQWHHIAVVLPQGGSSDDIE